MNRVHVVRDYSVSTTELWTYTALVLASSLAVALIIGFPKPVVSMEEGMQWYMQVALIIIGMPMALALACAYGFRGKAGLMSIWRRLIHVRVPFYLYAFALLAMPLGVIFKEWLTGLYLGVEVTHLTIPEMLQQWSLSLLLLGVLLLGEEVGWRGYYQPGLQASMTPFNASIVVGLVWGAWHFPVFWGFFHGMKGEALYGLIGIVEMTVLPILFAFSFTWLMNRGGAALMLALLAHAANNATEGLFHRMQLLESTSGMAFFFVSHAQAIPLAILATLVVWLDRERFFNRPERRSAQQLWHRLS